MGDVDSGVVESLRAELVVGRRFRASVQGATTEFGACRPTRTLVAPPLFQQRGESFQSASNKRRRLQGIRTVASGMASLISLLFLHLLIP